MHVSRDEQDAFALRSQLRAVAAHRSGRFAAEIIPVTIPQKKGEREPSLPSTSIYAPTQHSKNWRSCKPAFRKDGSVTAGNSAGINDGAAALVMMSRSRARKLGPPSSVRASSPSRRGRRSRLHGPRPDSGHAQSPATRGPGHPDMDLIELNEAFAAQALHACAS